MEKNARLQIKKLLLLDGVGNLMIAGGSWVALLAARGISTVEIGIFESIFHVASLLFEVPSGAVADVFGRKRVLVAGRIMSIISSMLMVISDSILSIGAAMVFCALSYNLASGTREALAYDSLKEADMEKEYDSYASADMIVFEITRSVSTLLAGVALMLGYKRAYAIDILVCALSVVIGLTLREVSTELLKESSISARFKEVARESAAFIISNARARKIIVFNAAVGAVSVLVLFFLQAKLPEYGLKEIWLGPALFIMGLGAVVGAKAVEYFSDRSYKTLGIFSAIGVLISLFSVFTGNYCIIIACGFIGAFADSFLQVRTDVVLNNMIPSEQRATLMSINSFIYSAIMIVLSPVFGMMFS